MGLPMSSLAEFIAAIVLWLSSMALCQFGMAIEQKVKAPPKAERVIARTPRQQAVQTLDQCPRLHAAEVSA
jgi:hypothetical protein